MDTTTQLRFYQVDAFTDKPFQGNPAAVLVLDAPLPAGVMQAVAAEMNLSETAFCGPPEADGLRHLRWFTPAVEVPLCGHATLATAHVLLRELGEAPPLRFRTLSGPLTVHEEAGGWLRMNLPADRPSTAAPPPGLLEALGCPPDVPVLRGEKSWVVRLGSEEEVRALAPDLHALRGVDPRGALGVAVTAPGSGEVDFVSRFFAPWVGVDEDPVTGVAHTALGPFWTAVTGRNALLARQLSHRPGEVRVRTEGERVHVGGRAVTVLRGEVVAAL